MVRDARDDEPCTISGETCAQTLKNLGFPRQAEWCRQAEKRRAAMYEDFERVSRERDKLLARLQKYEPPTVTQAATPVRWTGD